MVSLYKRTDTRVGAGGTWGDGFTLIELLVVIVIISVLATISMTGVKSAREKARQTNCMSNLRQIGVALVTYRGDHSGGNPNWLSNLYPSYIDDLSVYVCRSDVTHGRGLTPDGIDAGMHKYPSTIDNDYKKGSRPSDQNKDVEANSYFYEFSSAQCDFERRLSWDEYKEWEMRVGNGGNPFSSSKLPIVRCFHHAIYSKVDSYRYESRESYREQYQPRNGSSEISLTAEYVDSSNKRSTNIERKGLTLNVAYAGNVTIAPLWWQGAVEIGDTSND